jgi:hypothetical protein
MSLNALRALAERNIRKSRKERSPLNRASKGSMAMSSMMWVFTYRFLSAAK